MPILRFFSHKYFWQCFTPQIFSSLLMSRTYCTAAKHPQSRAKKSALNFSGENASIQASWELPGFVSSPVRILPRQRLKSAWSYVWIIKCPFSELEDRNFPQLWGIQVSIQQVSFKLVCFFSPLSHTIIKMKEVNADSLIFLWTGNVWSSIFIIQLLLAEILAVNFKFIGIFSLYTCTSQLLTMLLWAVCNHLDNKALWEACDLTLYRNTAVPHRQRICRSDYRRSGELLKHQGEEHWKRTMEIEIKAKSLLNNHKVWQSSTVLHYIERSSVLK